MQTFTKYVTCIMHLCNLTLVMKFVNMHICIIWVEAWFVIHVYLQTHSSHNLVIILFVNIILILIHTQRNGTFDAYLDDTPVLEYAISTMDAKCTLRLVGEGFGEDSYGIGLPAYSWLKVSDLTHWLGQYSVHKAPALLGWSRVNSLANWIPGNEFCEF